MTTGKLESGKAKRKRIERVYADYKHECENCGATPVVSLTGLCGPCTFGTQRNAPMNGWFAMNAPSPPRAGKEVNECC
jgi:hypothetical protein